MEQCPVGVVQVPYILVVRREQASRILFEAQAEWFEADAVDNGVSSKCMACFEELWRALSVEYVEGIQGNCTIL